MITNSISGSLLQGFSGITLARSGLQPQIGATSLGESIGTMLSGASSKDVSLKDINWAISRFPELSYHLGAIAGFVSFASTTPWANKDALGPAGISFTFSLKDTSGLNSGTVLARSLVKLRESGVQLSAITDFLKDTIRESANTETNPEENKFLRTVCKELIDSNGTLMKVYKMALSLLMYSIVIVDFNEDYSLIEVFSPDDIEAKKDTDQSLIRDWRNMSSTVGKEQITYKIKKTGKNLSDRARAVVINDGVLKTSMIGKVNHYLQIIDLIETAMSVERVTKSLSFLVWKVGIDGMPGEQVTDYLSTYRNIVMSRLKAGMKDNNVITSEINKSLSATHIFVPNFKDSPTTVENIKLEFKPLMTDLSYWWQKTFMSMGIPPYYNDVEKLQGASGGVTDFHENVFGSMVRMYQSVCEGILTEWTQNFLTANLNPNLINKYKLSVFLPIFVSSGEEARGEYMRRINQFASAFSTLSVAGMPIKPSFAVKLLFPNTDPTEVIDWKVRELSMGNAAEQSGNNQMDPNSYDPAVVDSLIGNMVSDNRLSEADEIPVNALSFLNGDKDEL